MKRAMFVLSMLAVSTGASAQILEIGTWVQRGPSKTPLVLTIEMAGSGRKLTYRVRQPDGKVSEQAMLTIVTQLDGQDASMMANGQPTGSTMAIRKLDAHHAITVLKMQGQQYGTSKAEISADGKVMTVENEITLGQPGQDAGKHVEYWDRK